MTPDQIKNLRALLVEAKVTLEFSITHNSDGQVLCLENINQALTLLPCETCNGTCIKHCLPKGGNTIVSKGFNLPCPDCQPCKRCGGMNGKHKQVDDPQAGNSNMLTKMQCPLDNPP